MRRYVKYIVALFIMVFLLLLSFPFINYSYLSGHYRSHIFSRVERIPEIPTALVLGAGLRDDKKPTDILRDRVLAAVELYKNGKVKKIIMSGDNREVSHNEPASMIALAKEYGIPDADLQPDYAGRRTYDSCWRAKNIFSLNKVIIVTQSFHLVRSLFICEKIGIEAVGFMSDTPGYSRFSWNYWRIRDLFALSYSLKDLYIDAPEVIGGKKIDI